MSLFLSPDWNRFSGDTRGIAAVEFALVLPLMLALYFGVVEISQIVRASQKVDQIAQTLADLTARKLSGPGYVAAITDQDLAVIYQAGTKLIWPLPTNKLHMEIDEIEAGDGNRNPHPPRVMWITSFQPQTYTAADGTRKPVRRECGVLDPANRNEFKRVPDSLAYSPNIAGYFISARVKYEYGAAVLPFLFGRGQSVVQWAYATLRAAAVGSINKPLTLAATRSTYNPVTCPE